MSSRKSKRAQLGALSGEIHPDDGVDPRRYFGGPSRRPASRKTLQLCAQVARALNLFLGECGDGLLRDLFVASVVPSPGPESLLVTVEIGQHVGPGQAREALERAQGRMRGGVGAAIT